MQQSSIPPQTTSVTTFPPPNASPHLERIASLLEKMNENLFGLMIESRKRIALEEEKAKRARFDSSSDDEDSSSSSDFNPNEKLIQKNIK